MFEVAKDQKVPKTKIELYELIKKNVSNWFHYNFCRECHLIPYHDHWFSNVNETEMRVFASVKKRGLQKNWEPFYIATNAEPGWDERLDWEGKSNKMQQVYDLCLQDYDFNVLSNAFLCHKPGIKTVDWNKENVREDYLKRTFEIIFQKIVPDSKALYGDREGCEIVDTGRNERASLKIIPGNFPLNLTLISSRLNLS